MYALIRGLIILFLIGAIGLTIEQNLSSWNGSSVPQLASFKFPTIDLPSFELPIIKFVELNFSNFFRPVNIDVASSGSVNFDNTQSGDNSSWGASSASKQTSKNQSSGSIINVANLPDIKGLSAQSLTLPSMESYGLTIKGIIDITNYNRQTVGNVGTLSENSKLDQAAKTKLDDLFAKQYFAHVSPTGIGPTDLANQVGYTYIVDGENLALGDFNNDQAVMIAWMNSPDHRANILDARFQEIGVAVGRGMYNGKSTWIAVQEFGKPVSSCPAVDAALKNKIDQLKSYVTSLESQLSQQKDAINQIDNSTPGYRDTIKAYNNLISTYNSNVAALKNDIDTYNLSVRTFNTCAGLQ